MLGQTSHDPFKTRKTRMQKCIVVEECKVGCPNKLQNTIVGSSTENLNMLPDRNAAKIY